MIEAATDMPSAAHPLGSPHAHQARCGAAGTARRAPLFYKATARSLAFETRGVSPGLLLGREARRHRTGCVALARRLHRSRLMTAPIARFLQIEPVGQCNLRCRMCAIRYRPDGTPTGPPAFLDYQRFTRLIDEAAGVVELQLQGLGEPMLHPRFFDMVEYATRAGIRVSTNTNGTLLHPAHAERCVTSGLDALHLSLDGASAPTYEAIRVRARFERVLANLDALMAARRRLDSEHPRVRIVAVVMRRNLDELAELVRLAARHGVRAVFVQHLCHEYGESTLPERYRPMREFVAAETLLGEAPERVARAFAAARRAAEEAGVELRLPRLDGERRARAPRGARRCDWPWKGPYLSYDGRAMPC
jgi:MoaA/NifB/PqqE/SkfB family radical SAM enzyme